jgi:fluoroacetyl-CoA thioesterase
VADLSTLTLGSSGTASAKVTPEKLATAVGSGQAPVFASPMMIALMEAACVDCVESHLPAGHQSLGTHLDVNHIAPTPEGLTVTATARLAGISGRKLTFEVEASDGVQKIGHGTHTRVVVDTPRFLDRLAAKCAPDV